MSAEKTDDELVEVFDGGYLSWPDACAFAKRVGGEFPSITRFKPATQVNEAIVASLIQETY